MIVEDIETDALWEPYRDLAFRHDLVSGWSASRSLLVWRRELFRSIADRPVELRSKCVFRLTKAPQAIYGGCPGNRLSFSVKSSIGTGKVKR